MIKLTYYEEDKITKTEFKKRDHGSKWGPLRFLRVYH